MEKILISGLRLRSAVIMYDPREFSGGGCVGVWVGWQIAKNHRLSAVDCYFKGIKGLYHVKNLFG